jgi:hypothetical protein
VVKAGSQRAGGQSRKLVAQNKHEEEKFEKE